MISSQYPHHHNAVVHMADKENLKWAAKLEQTFLKVERGYPVRVHHFGKTPSSLNSGKNIQNGEYSISESVGHKYNLLMAWDQLIKIFLLAQCGLFGALTFANIFYLQRCTQVRLAVEGIETVI